MALQDSVEKLARRQPRKPGREQQGTKLGSRLEPKLAARRTLWIGAALLLVLAGPSFVATAQAARIHKEHKRDYKREIEAVEQQWRTAQLSGDVATMDKLLAEDYFGISVAGELNNKSQQLERLRERSLVFTRIDVSDTKVKLLGGQVGVLTSLARIEATNDGTPMNGNFRYTRVYKRYTDGSWKITNFEVTRVPDRSER